MLKFYNLSFSVYNANMKNLGFSAADVLLPKRGIDLEKWAVVACDQYTADPGYWNKVEEFVKYSPSTLRITLPEIYLEKEGKEERIRKINETMREYIQDGIFDEYKDSFILVERKTETGVRFGLVGKLDLEEYDYGKDSLSLIRATEGTILSRIPPRKEIRLHAPLELPHIMVLISDEERSVIEPLRDRRDSLEVVYDTPLMMNGGRVTGYLIDRKEDKDAIYTALERMLVKLDPSNPLLYAMGDGNHSLATAKSLWEDIKQELDEDERKSCPARYALVEIENIFDPGLQFEPIHRIFYSLSADDFFSALENVADYTAETIGRDDIERRVNESKSSFVIFDGSAYTLVRLHGTEKELAAWTVQSVIDALLEKKSCSVDYIHGMNETLSLGGGGNIALILPDISKDTFFASILSDKAFPRKTFSIGHADEKRYYMEARRIR